MKDANTPWNGKVPAAVIFDMDGLLADTEPCHADCFVRAFAHFGIGITHEDYRQAVTLKGIPAGDLYVSKGGSSADWDRVKALKDSYMAEMVPKKATLMPGVHELLTLLKSSGIPTAVATSSRRSSLSIILDTFDLWSYFDHLITKDLVAAAEKPNPAGFLLAAEKLGVEPAKCVVMEDSPKGVIAAHRAGMKCIAVPNQSTADGDFSLATRVIKSLEQVDLRMLEGMFEDRPDCAE